MKKILFIAYPDYADFEVAHILFFARKIGKCEIITATVDGKSVQSLAGLTITPQKSLREVDVTMFDLILLPGGDGISLMLNERILIETLQKANARKINISSICASSVLVGQAGLLKDKEFTCNSSTYDRFHNVFSNAKYTGSRMEVSDLIITAKGTAFPDFTVAVGDKLEIWNNEEQRKHVLSFCKGEVD